MGNVKNSVTERTCHQRQYDIRVNKRQMQMQESKIDMGKAVDADLVVTESSGTKSELQEDSSKSGNDTDADDVDIRPIYDEEPMAEASYSTLAQERLTSNVDIPNIHECKQTLDLSAVTSINVQKEQSFDLSAGTSSNVKPDNLKVWLLKKLISQKPVLKWIQN
nr:hypothetical protein [Tanacetum cinerariifolium]